MINLQRPYFQIRSNSQLLGLGQQHLLGTQPAPSKCCPCPEAGARPGSAWKEESSRCPFFFLGSVVKGGVQAAAGLKGSEHAWAFCWSRHGLSLWGESSLFYGITTQGAQRSHICPSPAFSSVNITWRCRSVTKSLKPALGHHYSLTLHGSQPCCGNGAWVTQ